MQTQVVTKTVVFDNTGKLLVLRRADDDRHRPGGFDFPGGQVEPRESFVEGAVREVLEESGLRLDAQDIRLAYALTKTGLRDGQPPAIQTVWLGFVAKLEDTPAVRLSHEHKAFAWQTVEEAIADAAGTSCEQMLICLRDNDLVRELWS